MTKQTLLVSGCSMTHGSTLYNNFMHPNNITLSYSNHLADRLNCNLLNVAMAGGSNEYIFHSLVENISTVENIFSVIVMWTSHGRKYWKCNDRHYFMNAGFATSMADPVTFSDNPVNQKINKGIHFAGDTEEIVNRLCDVHRFFVTDFYDAIEEEKRLRNYRYALSCICQSNGIKLVDIDWDYASDIGNWVADGVRHPNAEEHAAIAGKIYKDFYEIKHEQ